jgi:NAD(P)-dependent dehydrogenase (short-subunit alcohol dehydrogenase family)
LPKSARPEARRTPRPRCFRSAERDRVLRRAEKHFGPVDVLVNNAGVEAGAHTFVTLDDEGWDTVIDTNLKGLWWMTRELTRRVAAHKQSGAVVVNISSITSERTTKGIFPYAVSKAGVNQATRVMALEGAKYNVRVNALAPGYIYTNVSKRCSTATSRPNSSSAFRSVGSANSPISTDRCYSSHPTHRGT